MKSLRKLAAIGLVLLAGFGATGCPQEVPEDGDGEAKRGTQRLLIEYDQNVVFQTSILTFRMKGSDRMVPHTAEITFEGQDGSGREIAYTGTVQSTPTVPFARSDGDQGDVLVRLAVSDGLWSELSPTPTARYTGAIGVSLVDEIGVVAEGRLEGMLIDFQADATPTVQGVPGGQYFPNETIPVSGSNFLRPDEGGTFAVVNGTYTYQDTELGEKLIANQRVPIEWTGSRTSAQFRLDPAVFGVRPGSFQGSLEFLNELSNLQSYPGNSQPSFIFDQGQPFLASLNPPEGSRGQRIVFEGRGFVPQDDVAGISMIFVFDGIFTYDDGGTLDITGANALPRVPDEVLSGTQTEMSVWYEIRENQLFGLGASPGVFEGTITPIYQDQFGEYTGVDWQGTFRVLPTKQMVYLKYLPGFSKGLEKFGLQNVEFEIRRRILEVTNRDYQGVNVVFVDRPPTDFIDFATVEIGGPDPTGGNKFGYDNTCNSTEQKCKDTRNLFLADYLGGVNSNSADQFNTPYGGIFIESFDFFSPTLNPESSDTSPAFDRIMSPFMPDLGGTPVKGTEYPNGERDAEINEAIHLVGSVIGNTCTHEVGHSLGLAFFAQDLLQSRPSEEFHNTIPGDNYIMDRGADRPFEERGEIEGKGPARFNDRNLEYLKDFLPVPQ